MYKFNSLLYKNKGFENRRHLLAQEIHSPALVEKTQVTNLKNKQNELYKGV